MEWWTLIRNAWYVFIELNLFWRIYWQDDSHVWSRCTFIGMEWVEFNNIIMTTTKCNNIFIPGSVVFVTRTSITISNTYLLFWLLSTVVLVPIECRHVPPRHFYWHWGVSSQDITILIPMNTNKQCNPPINLYFIGTGRVVSITMSLSLDTIWLRVFNLDEECVPILIDDLFANWIKEHFILRICYGY